MPGTTKKRTRGIETCVQDWGKKKHKICANHMRRPSWARIPLESWALACGQRWLVAWYSPFTRLNRIFFSPKGNSFLFGLVCIARERELDWGDRGLLQVKGIEGVTFLHPSRR